MKCSCPLCMLIWQCRSLKQQWLSVEFLIHTISKVLRKYWPRFHTALFIKWVNFELLRVQNAFECKCRWFWRIIFHLWVVVTQIHRVSNNSELKGAHNWAKKRTKRCTIHFPPKSATFMVKGAHFFTLVPNFLTP